MTSTSLRARLARPPILIAPGVYDPLTSLIAEQAGFEALYVSGAAIAYTRLGWPDIGLVSMSEVVETVALIRDRVRAHLVVDADTGYGNAINVIRTLQELIHVNAAGMFLEDQVWPKRCGHMKGKQVVPLDEQLNKLRAAIEAKSGRDFFIVARTDSRQALGLREAISRGIAFKQAGADAVFIEAPESKDEMKEIAREVPGPLVANMLERGVTPLMQPSDCSRRHCELYHYRIRTAPQRLVARN